MSEMNRRRFLSLLSVAAPALAIEQAIVKNRVWSFPKELVLVNTHEAIDMLRGPYLSIWGDSFQVKYDDDAAGPSFSADEYHRRCLKAGRTGIDDSLSTLPVDLYGFKEAIPSGAGWHWTQADLIRGKGRQIDRGVVLTDA